jgi:nitroreductase
VRLHFVREETHAMITLPDSNRVADHPIEALFLKRWSPRAMTGEPLTDAELSSLFEAARWAPSTYNEQEWRFLYARRGTAAWNLFFELLVDANQEWCRNAAILVLIAASRTFAKNGKPNPVHLFDCGNAFENLALQGAAMDLVVHGMSGFDYEKARADLKIPAGYAVVAMFAVGRPGDPARLPKTLREKEVPSSRRPIDEITCEGAFSFPEPARTNGDE